MINGAMGKPVEVLLVEDNPGDVRLTLEALKDGKVYNHLSVVEDGVKALAFLHREGEYAAAPRPDLILLDLNLPQKDGREVLAEIKADEDLKRIPVVVLTTSKAEEDILKTYNLHVNCYITKPVDFDQFVIVVRMIEDFWFTVVKLPRSDGTNPRFRLRIEERMNTTEMKERGQECTGEQQLNRIPESLNSESEIIRVLLIEDNPGDARLVREMLAETGADKFNLEHVERISQGLTRLSQEKFQVILLDLSLPDGHGLETVDRVCNAAPHIPVLVLTGLDDETLAIRAVQEGAQDYLVKGQMDGNLLIRAIRYATERKQTEQALRESEERFRRLAENAADIIFRYDLYPTPHLTYINNSAVLSSTGYTLEDWRTDPDLYLKIIHPDDRPLLEALLRGEVSTEKPFCFRWVGKDGTILWTEERDVPIYDEAGNLIAIEGIARDITERKRAEEEMAALQQQLRQAQKMEAVGSLAGGIAHDFNNLLTIMKGYSQLSLMELKDETPLFENIKEVQKATERASSLVRQLLAFGRRQVLEMKVVDLNTLLLNLDKMFRRIIGEDIKLVTVLAEGGARVKVDPGQMEQVIMNLAANARDAMPSGGQLTITTKNVEWNEEDGRTCIPISSGRKVVLSVSDTGVGMTQEVKERIFEPFFTTKDKGKGTGLGLSTVYGIIKQIGGDIRVLSEPGQGTTFRIYLLSVDEPVEDLEEKIMERRLPFGTETILIVEDEADVRKLVVRSLEKQGYKVLEASDGEEVLELFERIKDPIHLILADVIMPRMNGQELMEKLKSSYPEMKVIYMSGYTDHAIVHQSILQEGINFIQKPFSVDGLARKIREVLDKLE